MAAENQSPRDDQPITAEDVESAERKVDDARRGAAYAGLSAANSIAESARKHEQIADLVAEAQTHPESARRHRKAARDDRNMAERKRKESEADLAIE
jgi:hypothetical protein